MIAAIILAAGASKRFGRPKQLARLGPETLLYRAIRTAVEAGCDPVIVVLGAHHEEILAYTNLAPATYVVNHDWEHGMATSIRHGVNATPAAAKGVLLMTCDQPAVSAAHLRLLTSTGHTTASAYAGRHGVPAYFPTSMFAQLDKLHGDTGARELLQNATAIDFPEGASDIDTAADLQNAQTSFR